MKRLFWQEILENPKSIWKGSSTVKKFDIWVTTSQIVPRQEQALRF